MAAPAERRFVLKLGGSLANGPWLAPWLAALAGHAGPLVVVPGGGPFADAVRAAQARWRFDDRAAHRMALLAMEQFGLMLAALSPTLRPAASAASIARAQREGMVPVWLPTAMAAEAPDLAPSWDVTSDSLAAWLAGRLGIRRLVLVKSAPLERAGASAAALVASGVIDAALPVLLSRHGLACDLVAASAHAAWARGEMPALRLAAEGFR